MENNSKLYNTYINFLLIFEGEKEEFIRELNGQNGKELENQIEKIIFRHRKYKFV